MCVNKHRLVLEALMMSSFHLRTSSNRVPLQVAADPEIPEVLEKIKLKCMFNITK